MSYTIDEIEGIGPVNKEKLEAAGIQTTEDFLKSCCDSKGRDAMSEKIGVSASQLLKWANMADLMRISGIGKQYSELLEAAGVDTVKELKMRNAANLTEKMQEINAAKNLAKTSPAESVVSGWIDQAGQMEALITH